MTCYLDLFSGIGGFALGAYWAGLRFDKHYFSEVDDYAVSVYQKRFSDSIPLGDIRGIKSADLPSGDWIISGGFPCQDISIAGKGAGLAGSRSGLWFEYARLIGELRPQYAIMENVGALTIRGIDAVLRSLAEIGYDAEWQDIRASDVGAPHRRERIWIVAYPDEILRDWAGGTWGGRAQLTDGGKEIPYSERIDDDNPRSGAGEICRERSEKTEIPGRMADTYNPRWDASRSAIASGWAESDAMPRRTGQQRSRHPGWAAEPGFCRVANGVPSRVDRLKCLGNSIVPQIAEMIFSTSAFDEWRTA
jgi:DNA (cytosine-5)-methyltransferase 1